MDITFQPMMKEPKFKHLPGDCRCKASHAKALATLKYELGRIGATNVVLEAGFTDRQLRLDGTPRAEHKPVHSTVRITFKKDGKLPLSFTAGGHSDWVINIYLVAKTLEMLRAVERYACVQGEEQYRGFSSLPPGASSIIAAEWASPLDAAHFLATLGGYIVPRTGIPTNIKEVYHTAAKKAHPDAGGSTDLMSKVNRAMEFIEKAEAN
jgi:hypothetical protein